MTSNCIHLYSAIGQQWFYTTFKFKKIIIDLSVVIKISSFSHFLQKKLHKYYGYVIQLWHPKSTPRLKKRIKHSVNNVFTNTSYLPYLRNIFGAFVACLFGAMWKAWKISSCYWVKDLVITNSLNISTNTDDQSVCYWNMCPASGNLLITGSFFALPYVSWMWH